MAQVDVLGGEARFHCVSPLSHPSSALPLLQKPGSHPAETVLLSLRLSTFLLSVQATPYGLG